ncbi:translation initiation factor IF-2 [Puniceicoccales bacterium CK1056]|uniref:Translation initiation factor IF-2 n=1 Tax=Oceanipulchritudo coccoides TaxID=2706888 RepID=A0A6B2M079_9BACT|nr:translation initiation factor IF-2 [Oceanipulchritudo coccoides]NDV61165.1 translation initiation factor IF-2 [Oceanipulchritudo coccoides]
MSVRIYQLSKEIGMENAELIALLKERGYEVKSASSTVDNISAESLREEFGPKPEESEGAAPEEEKAEAPPVEVKIVPPSGAIVRSKEDIERERREREEEEEAKRKAEAPAPPVPAPNPGKTPPPLPRSPGVIRRTVTPSPLSGGTTPKVAPKAPILRTDLPKQEVSAKEVAEEKPTIAASAPTTKSPPPIVPPAKKGPPPIAPPSFSKPEPEAAVDETPSEEAPVEEVESEPADNLIPLQVRSPIVVRDFALQIGRKPFQLISELMEMSIFASMNSSIEEDVAQRLAKIHGFALEVRHRGEGGAAGEAEKVVEEKKPAREMVPRPPVVCILGHVDHGKTTLLDTIRKANVVSSEAGGITQHIGAYQVTHKDKLITFIDTPGHAAFSNMRARGARTTDIAVLVVAADDGFMPQTDEALGHARVSKVPVVVAINKMDAPGANVDKVLRQMQERDLAPEDWGGETLYAKVSALKGEGIEDILEAIVLQADVTETIVADPKGEVEGVIVEAQKELGRGSTASAIIQQGTLKPGMALVCGENYCRVRQLINDKGEQIKEAGPSSPVKIVGWSGPPDAGDFFKVVKNEREAKKHAEANELDRKKLEATQLQERGSTSVDDLFAAIEKTQKKSFTVLVKADVYGTAEALATSLQSIKSEKIDLEVVDMGVGDITRNDVLMSSAAKATIIGFNVGIENGVTSVAKHHGVNLIQHNIIYELITQVKDAMTDMLDPELRENKIGAAEIRQVFPVGKGVVAGCMVTEGRIQRDSIARLVRGGEVVAESKISTLKRFKDDVTEVRAGYECGIQIDGYNAYEEKDIIEVFEILKIKPDL